ncbi:MAG: hypothetical protein J2P23_04025 [Microlunatus sp.]|nr:hypothetical protein [Microlunatus sp.]
MVREVADDVRIGAGPVVGQQPHYPLDTDPAGEPMTWILCSGFRAPVS